jgi:hypothetical protein
MYAVVSSGFIVESVPVWCHIKFYGFLDFADEYTGESGVIALL